MKKVKIVLQNGFKYPQNSSTSFSINFIALSVTTVSFNVKKVLRCRGRSGLFTKNFSINFVNFVALLVKFKFDFCCHSHSNRHHNRHNSYDKLSSTIVLFDFCRHSHSNRRHNRHNRYDKLSLRAPVKIEILTVKIGESRFEELFTFHVLFCRDRPF